MSDDTELNMKGLEQMLKSLKSPPNVRVGIIGDKSPPRTGEVTNASIGAKHEFGESGMPIRSFLRMPLTLKMQDALDESKFFDPVALKKVVAMGDLTEWMQKIGIVAESVVLDAFDTGGFGQWKPSIMDHKKNQQTLVETGQLRNAITSEVK